MADEKGKETLASKRRDSETLFVMMTPPRRDHEYADP